MTPGSIYEMCSLGSPPTWQATSKTCCRTAGYIPCPRRLAASELTFEYRLRRSALRQLAPSADDVFADHASRLRPPLKLTAHMPTPDLRVVLIVPAVMVSALAASSWFELRTFNEKQPFVQTQGSVASLDCGNHGSYRVTYVAGDRTITGGAGSLPLKSDCRDLSLNQKIPVWYSSSDPSFASFVDPTSVPSGIHSEMGAMLFLGYPFVALFLYLAMRFKLYTKRVR
jgi:hypothetical protein